ncbi:AbrB/MazE/SpoVT family DNA-binding domain-containing protein [Anoxybacillus ayderensis]|uniref:AbrB/MazE/SpoVT family DNA-binding domain-containing protein n=1 Tax=Anoxybacillus ayderensis TaxID=265546 RepID=UPI0011780626|nr:AbrB/MazE/SpoVT family DNA-binding domain-containing protein [Anoxybacillus ayderensis]
MKDYLFASATITGKRQITIPKEVSDYLDLKIGDKVIFREKNGSVLFEKDVYSVNPELSIDSSFKMNFIIPFTKLSDLLTLDRRDLIREIFDIANEVLTRGGKVILQKEYVNVAPVVMKVYDEVEEFNEFADKFLSL